MKKKTLKPLSVKFSDIEKTIKLIPKPELAPNESVSPRTEKNISIEIQYSHRSEEHYVNISFTNCIFEDTINFDDNNYFRYNSFIFYGCTFKKGLKLEKFQKSNLYIKCSHSHFEKGIFINESRIKTLEFVVHVNLSQEVVNPNTFGDNAVIEIKNKSELGNIFLGHFKKELHDIDSITFSDVDVTGAFLLGNFKIKRSLILEKIRRKGGRNNDVRIENIQIEKAFTLDEFACGIDGAVLSNISAPRLSINATSFSQTIGFTDCDFSSFHVKGFLNNQALKIQNLKTNDFLIQNFTTNQAFKINSIVVTGEDTRFHISNSDLEGCQLFNINLTDFQNVMFHDSIISDARFDNITWKEDFAVSEGEAGLKKKKKHQLRRELHYQFKSAYEKQKNRVMVLKHQKYEQDALMWESFFSGWKLPDSLILFLNKITNVHGQNWFWSFILLTIAYFAFSYGLIYQIEYENPNSGLLQKHFWSIHWQLFNPAHLLSRISEIKDYQFSGYVHGIDTAYRIVISFLIYQTIRASRKFVK